MSTDGIAPWNALACPGIERNHAMSNASFAIRSNNMAHRVQKYRLRRPSGGLECEELALAPKQPARNADGRAESPN
jgi:hypothetical protein